MEEEMIMKAWTGTENNLSDRTQNTRGENNSWSYSATCDLIVAIMIVFLSIVLV